MCFDWKKEYETGHPIVDFQHRQLFNALFALMEMCASGKKDRVEATAEFLVGFAHKHIQDMESEKLLSRRQYPFQHSADYHHEKLLSFVTALEKKLRKNGPSSEIREEIGQYLKDSLIDLFNHINKEKEDRIISELTLISGYDIPVEPKAPRPIARRYGNMVTPVGSY